MATPKRCYIPVTYARHHFYSDDDFGSWEVVGSSHTQSPREDTYRIQWPSLFY